MHFDATVDENKSQRQMVEIEEKRLKWIRFGIESDKYVEIRGEWSIVSCIAVHPTREVKQPIHPKVQGAQRKLSAVLFIKYSSTSM